MEPKARAAPIGRGRRLREEAVAVDAAAAAPTTDAAPDDGRIIFGDPKRALCDGDSEIERVRNH